MFSPFESIQLICSLAAPAIMVVGTYIALKIDVTRNQEKIAGLKDDTTEIKADVKELKKHFMIQS